MVGLVGVSCIETFAAREIERRISGRADVAARTLKDPRAALAMRAN
jgi:hypothetical protein